LKRTLLVLFITLSLLLPAMARNGPSSRPAAPAAPSPVFLELWNSLAYYDTNLERTGFASLLGRYEGKIGLNVFELPLQIYGVYYGVSSQSEEHYNNSIFSGAGMRIMPFQALRMQGFVGDIIRATKIYGEQLSSSYQRNAASAAGLATEDTRYGIEVYREWNLDNPDPRQPWAELWTKFDYRDTNFGWEEFKDYVFYCQPKIGRHLDDGIQVYLRADVTASGKDTPAYYFLNVVDYGVGIRFEPWRKTGHVNDFLRKFKMYAEFLGVSYLRHAPEAATPPGESVSTDVRFGIEFSYGR
jgi:hypothetical protein